MLQTLLSTPGVRVHLIGVGGSGMSSLAQVLLQRGCKVSGSDLTRSSAVETLERAGLHFWQGHHAEAVQGADLVIYSSAVREENAERIAATKAGIRVVRRAEGLAAVCQERRSMIISGTHGKTTTTTLLAHILVKAGRKPGFYVGAEAPVLGASANWGEGAEVVIEADESDGSMTVFHPEQLLVLNIEAEHLDFYDSFESILRAFAQLANQTRGTIVCCADDAGAVRLAEGRANVVRYGFAADAAYRAEIVELKARCSVFRVYENGELLETFELSVPGRHNVSNATGAIAMARLDKVPVAAIAEALKTFRGARRRFDVHFEDPACMVVDDYAHHPSEIRATLETARKLGRKRVLAAFQPHRYSRTSKLRFDFAHAFDDADEVVLTDIYPASEDPIPGVDGQLLPQIVREAGHASVGFAPTLKDLKTEVTRRMQEGDVVVVMGAGSVATVARQIAEDLKVWDMVRKEAGEGSIVRSFEPMSKHTSLRLGGPAQVWFEPADEAALARVLAKCHAKEIPVTVIGRGTNLVVRDHGIRGVCIHLGRPAFAGITISNGRVEAAAGARLKQVAYEAKKAGLAGFEFMEGIPGNLGGALRMNAGAMHAWTFEVVESIRTMDRQGNIHTFKTEELEVCYRHVPLLDGHIALGAVLKGVASGNQAIQEKMDQFSRKRWGSQPAAPSAGCTFKNPGEIPAGKLIDELGLKDLRVGAARVSEVHANFIVNEGGATAADVLELIRQVREKAKTERGIELEPEVMILGE